jgi:hypothetical protein
MVDNALTTDALRALPSAWKMLLFRRLLKSTSECSVHLHVSVIYHIPPGGERLSSCSAKTTSDGRPRTAVSMICSTNDFGSSYACCQSHHVHKKRVVQVEKTFQLYGLSRSADWRSLVIVDRCSSESFHKTWSKEDSHASTTVSGSYKS